MVDPFALSALPSNYFLWRRKAFGGGGVGTPSRALTSQLQWTKSATEPYSEMAQVKEILSGDLDYASVVEGILQVTPDIEEEIATADRGETVQMDVFKTMFAKWLA